MFYVSINWLENLEYIFQRISIFQGQYHTCQVICTENKLRQWSNIWYQCLVPMKIYVCVFFKKMICMSGWEFMAWSIFTYLYILSFSGGRISSTISNPMNEVKITSQNDETHKLFYEMFIENRKSAIQSIFADSHKRTCFASD